MPSWSPAQYLKFGEERTRPCRELSARVDLTAPRHIIDLGCGPGNSTDVLAQRWPDAEITGLDNSPRMIETARAERPGWRWVAEDITEWAASHGDIFDLVFSNAALQWLPDHAGLLPRLIERVASGGALAFQMPAHDSPAHDLMRRIASARRLRVNEWHSHEPAFYYDTVAPWSSRVDVWTTEYQHVMPNAEGIVEWYRGTGLRPYLEALATDAERSQFEAELLAGFRVLYPERADGRVLFPFRRIFAVAYRD